jgi:hypothetical protein
MALLNMNGCESMILAAKLLEEVLSETMLPEDALVKWPELSAKSPKILRNAWTCLRHFTDDSDIHIRDPEYLRDSRGNLSKFAIELMAQDR